MLGDEFGTASNIKSRVNRQSVLGAITSAQQRLKLYNKVSSRTLLACSSYHIVSLRRCTQQQGLQHVAADCHTAIADCDMSAGATKWTCGVHWYNFNRRGQRKEGQH